MSSCEKRHVVHVSYYYYYVLTDGMFDDMKSIPGRRSNDSSLPHLIAAQISPQ